ncbi:M23 family metallopeptidase [Hyalangium gracile]|uniref:M23 family metallopeptidase n=1 Tax=Hyalangium gracile TaxID=394092 RepID=UPI001CC9A675|nr:M23 family metallopeptidase [Hyalangium gracile]
MRPSLPTLGEPPKRSRFGSVVVFSLILGGAAGGVWWWKQNKGALPLQQPPAAVAVSPQDAGTTTAAAPTPPPAPVDPLVAAGLQRASVKIDGPLETALVQASGPTVGPALAQVVTRSLVWWVRVPNEILRGDTLDVLYQPREGEEPLVHAVRFVSGKTGQTHRAYRFVVDATARFYQPDGQEMEERLEHSPLDDYEQVTSLLRDGRGHKGVDFKAPVGTPVKAPFTGVVKRKNWNFSSNGNCIELEELGGKRRRALFLHLSELPKSLKAGARFSLGQVIAESGNSGRSYAPHLHYQLMTQDDRVIDPFESHRTYRRTLDADRRSALDAEIRRMDSLLSPPVAGN